MRWPVFVLALALALVVDAALMPALEIGGATPTATGALVVFICLLAARDRAWLAAVLGGLALDLTATEFLDGRPYVVPGPWALGFGFGATLLLVLRGSLVRRNPLTVSAATFTLLMAASVVWAALWSVRAWYPEGTVPWGDERVVAALADRFRWALWSAIMAIPVSWLLIRTIPAWGFPGVTGRTLR